MGNKKEKVLNDDRQIEPMIPMDYPDPDVIRVGDTYVMVSTTMHFFPGGPVLFSKDLVNWKIASYLFDSLDDTPAERLEGEENIYGHGMWAPTLRFHDGKYYVAFVSHMSDEKPPEFVFDPIMGMQMVEKEPEEICEYTHLFVSDSIYGPWEHRIIDGYYHDCSLLFDDDGRNYIIHGNTEIRITELNADLTGPLKGGLDRVIVEDNPDEMILGYEGSHFYKINGKYYLALIHWPIRTGRRTQAVFMSDSLTGKFVGRDVLSEGSFFNQGIAQGGFFDTPDGEWYSIMFRDSGAVGRMPILCKLRWEDDYLYFDINAKTPIDYIDQAVGKLDLKEADDLICSSNFTAEGSITYELAYAWQWNHKPSSEFWHLIDENTLSITTNKIAANPTLAQNVPTQRMLYPECYAEVTVDVTKLKEGDCAGLMVLQGNYAFIGIERSEGVNKLITIVNNETKNPGIIGSHDNSDGEIEYYLNSAEPCFTFMIAADFKDMNDRVCMYYKRDSEWVPIGEEHKLHFGLDHFTGARVGLCVFSKKEIGGTAVFRDFAIGGKSAREKYNITSGLNNVTSIKERKAARNAVKRGELEARRELNLRKFANYAYYRRDDESYNKRRAYFWLVTIILDTFVVMMTGELFVAINPISAFAMLALLVGISVAVGKAYLKRYRDGIEITRATMDKYERFFKIAEIGASEEEIDQNFLSLYNYVLDSYECWRMVRTSTLDGPTRFEVVSYLVAMRMSEERRVFLMEYMESARDKGLLTEETAINQNGDDRSKRPEEMKD